MHTRIVSPDPTILKEVLRAYKADEVRGELIGQAIVIERELDAWYSEIEVPAQRRIEG